MALPGVQTVISDRFYSLSRTDTPSGPTVLAIGVRNTASGTNGVTDYDPYVPNKEQDVIAAYGSGSQLHRAYLELLAGGATRVVLVALPEGTTDTDIYATTTGNVTDTAFAAAESAQPDFIVPWGRGGHPTEWTADTGYVAATPSTPPAFGYYADNAAANGSSMAQRVATWCANISSSSHPVLGVLGVKPWVGTSTAATENIAASDLATHLGFPNLDPSSDAAFTNGMYLALVATELVPVGVSSDFTYSALDFGYSNGATTYAAALAQLNPWDAATNRVVFNVNKLRFNPTSSQQLAMTQAMLCPVALDFNRVPRFIDSMTYAASGSDFARVTTMRITFAAISMVRSVAQQFVGKGATLQVRNSLETAITAGLRNMTQLGALYGSDFVVSYDPANNVADVTLVLTPAFELRNINVTVSVQL